MKGLQILTHSWRLVTGNLQEALKISGALYLAQVVVGLLLGQAAMGAGIGAGATAGVGIGALAVLIVSIIAGIWIAVGWHRFVLLAERPDTYVPVFRGDLMKAYFLKSLLLGLIIIALSIVLGVIVGLIASPLMSMGGGFFALLIMTLLVQVPVIFLALRITAILPGSAIGVDHPLMAGWEATKADNVPLLQLALILGAAIWVINLIGVFVFGSITILAVVWHTITGWFVMMVGVSILTTLYGHYIEKRPLG